MDRYWVFQKETHTNMKHISGYGCNHEKLLHLRILFASIHPNINLIGRVYFETLKALQPLHVMLHVPIIANE